MKSLLLTFAVVSSLLLPAAVFAQTNYTGGGFAVRGLGASGKVRLTYGDGTNNWLTISPRYLIETGMTAGKHPKSKTNKVQSFAPLRYGAATINVASNDCGTAVDGSISASKLVLRKTALVSFTTHFGSSCDATNLVACDSTGTNCVSVAAGTPEVQFSLSISNWPFRAGATGLVFDLPVTVPDGAPVFGNLLNNFLIELPNTAVVDGVVTPITITGTQKGTKLDLQFVFPPFTNSLSYN